MGGVNCDESGHRCRDIIDENTEWAEKLQDQREYGLAVDLYSRSQFSAHKRFLELQSTIELINLIEAHNRDYRLPEIMRFKGILYAYISDLESLLTSNKLVSDVASNNFSDKKTSELRKKGYLATVNSTDREVALNSGLIPKEEAEWLSVSTTLVKDGEQGLFEHQKMIINTLIDIVSVFKGKLLTLDDVDSSINVSLFIRELKTPVIPFSLKSQTAWIRLSETQLYWALMNTISFSSLSGIDTPITELAK